MKRTIFDPPSGWRYGFPKPLPDNVKGEGAMTEWLIAQGYPREMIGLALKHSRYWEETEPA